MVNIIYVRILAKEVSHLFILFNVGSCGSFCRYVDIEKSSSEGRHECRCVTRHMCVTLSACTVPAPHRIALRPLPRPPNANKIFVPRNNGIYVRCHGPFLPPLPPAEAAVKPHSGHVVARGVLIRPILVLAPSLWGLTYLSPNTKHLTTIQNYAHLSQSPSQKEV